MAVIWPPLCVRQFLEWVCVAGVRGCGEGFRRAWHKEEKNGRVCKPSKKINVFVCGQQWHSKLFVGPNCLELILPFLCCCMIRKRTFTEYLQSYFFVVWYILHQNATWPMIGSKCYQWYKAKQIFVKLTQNHLFLTSFDSLKQTVPVYRSIFQKSQ